MTTTISIPDEILDLIFAMVVDSRGGRFWSLHRCSLVCRRWNTLCKPHIFHTITLISKYINHTLSALFYHQRGIPPYIKCLRIAAGNLQQKTLSNCMPRCFELFTGLRYLDVGGVGRFSDHQVGISEGLAILVSAPNLQRLRLRGWHLDDGFAHLTALLRLCSKTLLHLVLEADFHERLSDTDKIRNFVDETVDMQALQTLDLVISASDSEVFLTQPLIRCPNLREYTARMPYVSNSPERLLPIFIEADLDVFTFHVRLFPRFPSLQFKNPIPISQLTLKVGSRHDSYQELFDWVKDCIMALPFPQSLRGITLDLDVATPHGCDHPIAADCRLLVDALHPLVKNGALSHVHLKLYIIFTSENEDDEVPCREHTLLELQKGFSMLSNEGVFAVPDIVCQAVPGIRNYT